MNKWLIKYSENSLPTDIDNKKIIYLTPDATEEMESYECDNIYIIGGLID